MEAQAFDAEDELVGLRPFSPHDAADVVEACQDTEIIRWTTKVPSPYLYEHALWWIRQHDAWRADRTAFPFAIVDKRSERLAGSIGVDEFAGASASVGYWIAAWARRRGQRRLRRGCRQSRVHDLRSRFSPGA